MNIRKLLTVALSLLVIAGVMAGNPEKKGTAGAEELLIPVDARGTALGGSATASISGIDAVYWNPAGLGNSTAGVEALFSYMKYIADINITYGAVAAKTGIGTVGVSFQSIGFGDIPITTADSPDGTGSMYTPRYLTVGAMYSKAMTDRIFVGVNGKLVSEKIINCSASTFAFDVGVQYVTSVGLKMGVVLKNLGAPLRFDGTDLERRVSLPDVKPGTPDRNLRIVSEKYELPSLFEIGLSYGLKPIEKTNIQIMANFRNDNFANDLVTGGVEMDYNDMFFVRGGYTYSLNEGEDAAGGVTYIWGPSFGFGVKYPLTAGMKFAFDFAYRTAEYFSDNMFFTAKFLF